MSGQQIGTAVGFVAGFFLPGGPTVWAGIGGMIGGAISPTKIEGPRLTDGMGVTAQDGVPNPWGFGTFSTGVNVINAFDLVEHEHVDDGKGSGMEQTTYTYTRSFALGVCRAKRNADGTYSDIAGIARVTHNGKDVYNALPDATDEQRANNAKFLQQYKIYLGGEGQTPDPTLEAYLGAGNASAYRGQVYIVGTDIDQTDSGGAMGTWEVVVAMGGQGADVYASFQSGATIQSSNNVADWVNSNTGLSGSVDVLGVAMDGVVALRTNEGAYSADGGLTWTAVSGLPSGVAPAGVLYSDSIGQWIISYSLYGTVIRTADFVTFEACPTSDSTAIYTGAARDNVVILGSPSGRIFRSTNGGLSFPEWLSVGGASLSTRYPLANKTYFTVAISNASSFRYSATGAAGSWSESSVPSSLSGVPFGAATDGVDTVVYALLNGDTLISTNGGVSYVRGPSHSGTNQGQGNTNHLTYHNGRYLLVVEQSVYAMGSDFSSWELLHTTGGDLYEWIVSAPPHLNPAPGTLAEIVTEVCRRSGLSSSDIDVSQLTQHVQGFKVATETTGEAIIASLMPGYFFDVGEWDDKLRFVTRGGAPVAHLSVDDLAERDGPIIEETEVQEVELLRKVIVHAMDPASGYIEVPQSWERRAATVAATGEQTISLPVVMTADEMKQVAQKRVKVGWTEIRRFVWSLPYTRPEFTPTDCITITDRAGRTQAVRLEQMTEDSGILEVREAKLYRQSAYTSNAVGISHGQRPTTTPQPVGPTFFWAGNLPSLRTSDNVPGMYIAAAGYQRGWHGASIWLSTDGGASFQRIVEWPRAARMGVLTADITDSSEPVPVFMNSGTLSTVTDDQLANRSNGFAITTAGVSEVGQFKTATLSGAMQYGLTDTVRGGLGTTAAAHATGDPFVMLSSVQFLPIDISHAGKTLIFKAVSYSQNLDETPEYPVVFSPLFTRVVIEQYTDDTGEGYTDDAGNPYYYETTA